MVLSCFLDDEIPSFIKSYIFSAWLILRVREWYSTKETRVEMSFIKLAVAVLVADIFYVLGWENFRTWTYMAKIQAAAWYTPLKRCDGPNSLYTLYNEPSSVTIDSAYIAEQGVREMTKERTM